MYYDSLHKELALNSLNLDCHVILLGGEYVY